MFKRIAALLIAALMLLAVLPAYAIPQAAPIETEYSGSYYTDNGVNIGALLAESGNALLSDLNSLMTRTHTHITSYNEIRDMLVGSDPDPAVPGNLILFYSRVSANGSWDSGVTFNREHVWPQSLGSFSTSNAGADLHHIRPTDPSVNNARGSRLMAWIDSPGDEIIYHSSSAVIETECYINAGNEIEPRDAVKGDVARIYFYVAARWGEDLKSPVSDDTFQTLLEWNLLDPADTSEQTRNDYAESVQGNRNVFIDYPEFGRLVYGSAENGFDYTPVTSGDYTYYVKDGSAVIVSYNGSASAVTVPGTLGGFPVTELGCASFANNTELTSVLLPESVTKIGSHAFYNDPALASLYVQSASAVTFARRALRRCPSLTGVYFSGAAPVFENEDIVNPLISGSDINELPEGLKIYYVNGMSGWSGWMGGNAGVIYTLAQWDGTGVPETPCIISVGTATGAHPGDTVTVPVTVSGEYEAHTIQVKVEFDPDMLTLNAVTSGPLVSAAEGAMFLPETSVQGTAAFSILGISDPVTGSGVLANLRFTVSENCTQDQPLHINVVSFDYAPIGQTMPSPIPHDDYDGAILMAEPDPTPTPEPTAEPTAAPTPAGEGSYVLVTDIADITDGDYVLYGVNGNNKGAMSAVFSSSGRFAAEAVTISGDTVVDPAAEVVWRLEKQADGSVTLYNAAENIYCVINGDSTSGFAAAQTAESGFTVEYRNGNSTSNFFLKSTDSSANGRGISIYQSDFRPYLLSNAKDLYLYKFIPAAHVYHTVTFVDWDGTVLSVQEVEEGASAAAPEVPGREGYTFIGWDTDFSSVTTDLTVTALYEQNAPQYLKGDVNCDGIVDSADITLAAAYSMSAGEVTAQGVANGDMNGDGFLTAADLSALYSYIQG